MLNCLESALMVAEAPNRRWGAPLAQTSSCARIAAWHIQLAVPKPGATVQPQRVNRAHSPCRQLRAVHASPPSPAFSASLTCLSMVPEPLKKMVENHDQLLKGPVELGRPVPEDNIHYGGADAVLTPPSSIFVSVPTEDQIWNSLHHKICTL